MSKFNLDQVPVQDLNALGLHDGNNILLPKETIDQLLSGKLTDFVKMNDIKIFGIEKPVSIDAKLTLRQKEDGTTGLLIHPIYKNRMDHPELTQGEANDLEKGGILRKSTAAYGKLLEHGPARYEFDKDNSESYFIKLEKLNGEKSTIWGVELGEALKKSGKNIGDIIQINHKGKEAVEVEYPIRNEQKEVIGSEKKMVDKNLWEIGDYQKNKQKETFKLYEFDKETNSFVSISDKEIQDIQSINGIPLTPDQKRKYKEGETVDLADGSSIKASPKSSSGVASNRWLLVASVVLDGGLSYSFIKLTELLIKLGNKQLDKTPSPQQNKDYLEQLNAIKSELTDKLEANPENKKIANDLSILNKILSSENLANEETTVQDVKDVKTAVNDPDLKQNASEEKEIVREKVLEEKEVKPDVKNEVAQDNLKIIKEPIENVVAEKVIKESSPELNVQSELKMTHVAFVKSKTDGTLYIDQQKENDRSATFQIVQDNKGSYFYTLNESNKDAMVTATTSSSAYLNNSVATTLNDLNRPTIETKAYTGLSYLETKYKPVEKLDSINFKVIEKLELKGVYNTDFSVEKKQVDREEKVGVSIKQEQHTDKSQEENVERSSGLRR